MCRLMVGVKSFFDIAMDLGGPLYRCLFLDAACILFSTSITLVCEANVLFHEELRYRRGY